MSLTATAKGGGAFEPVEPGIYTARCYGVIDLGTQHNEQFNADRRRVILMWELPEVRITIEGPEGPQDRPRVVSHEFTLSLSSQANLRAFLETWRGRAFTPDELEGFDMKTLLGTPCQVQVMERVGKDLRKWTYVNQAIKLSPNTEIREQELPTCYFSFEEHDGTSPLPQTIPEWIRNKIEGSREWQGVKKKIEMMLDAPPGSPPHTPPEDDFSQHDNSSIATPGSGVGEGVAPSGGRPLPQTPSQEDDGTIVIPNCLVRDDSGSADISETIRRLRMVPLDKDRLNAMRSIKGQVDEDEYAIIIKKL